MNYFRLKSLAHRYSAIVLFIFILSHLVNHLLALGGMELHESAMEELRSWYRTSFSEGILIGSVLIQVLTGILHVRQVGVRHVSVYDKLQVFSGLYLVFFLVAHTTAIMQARYGLEMETGFYFAATVWIIKPYAYVFALYYLLGILAFFVHIASALRWILQDRLSDRMRNSLPWLLMTIGVLVWLGIALAFTGTIYEIDLPEVNKQYLP